MGAKKSEKREIDSEWFKLVVRECGWSIRKLGDSQNGVGWCERTIRRALEDGCATPALVDGIAKKLDVYPDFLTGDILKRINWDELPDEESKQEFKRRYLRPEAWPYVYAEQDRIGLSSYYSNILTMHGISADAYKALDIDELHRFVESLDYVITKLLRIYFPDCSPVSEVERRQWASFDCFADFSDLMLTSSRKQDA